MRTLYCITCPVGCKLSVIGSGFAIEVDGHKCEKGVVFAKAEMSNPSRTLTTTVRTKIVGVPVVSVRTNGEIPRDKMAAAMAELNDVVVDREMDCGEVLVEDIAGTGVQVIITSSILMQLGAELENKNVLFNKSTDTGGGVSASAVRSGGIGIVRNEQNVGVLDDIGADAVGGLVGTAGSAVGVADGDGGDDTAEAEEDTSYDRPKGRSHITRRPR